MVVASPAAAGSTVYRDRYSGIGGSATLTDCPVPAAEVTCHATLVHASVDTSGTGGTYAYLSVQLVTVHLHPDGSFGYDFADYGYTESASITVDPKLTSGHASGAVDLSSGGTLPVDVQWTGTGTLERNSSTYRYKDGCVSYRDVFKGKSRPARATGTIGGSPQRSVENPLAPATTLFSTNGSFVERTGC